MIQYLDLLSQCRHSGHFREGRNGGTYGLFGAQMRFDLHKGFPLMTTKRIHWKSVVAELLWFLSGSTNVKPLQEQGVRIWNEWADEDGELGPVYGKQWRDFNGVDQINNVMEGLIVDPYGRRHIVSAWNPVDIPDMTLPPCHCMFQFFVADGRLSCQLYQRSADMFLGVPFNIASYALLTHLVAREVGLGVGEFIHVLGDYHIYANHLDQVNEQLGQTPRPLPNLVIDSHRALFDLRVEDVTLDSYDPCPAIKAEVSV